VLWWTHRLLLRRTYHWTHRDGASPGIVEGGPHRGASAIVTAVVARAVGAVVLAFSLPCALTLAFATIVVVWGQEGEGPPGDTAVPAVVGAEAVAAVESTLHLRARSRTWRHVPGPPSGLARSPRVRGRCGRCGRRDTVATA
jgi:hypothetical protein